MNKFFYVYILASQRNETLYTGSTDNLGKRVWQHKEEVFQGFTAKYGVDRLVWCEAHRTRDEALLRERRIKKWNRKWKINLIESENPDWVDLFATHAHG